jgi:hypothetical protein
LPFSIALFRIRDVGSIFFDFLWVVFTLLLSTPRKVRGSGQGLGARRTNDALPSPWAVVVACGAALSHACHLHGPPSGLGYLFDRSGSSLRWHGGGPSPAWAMSCGMLITSAEWVLLLADHGVSIGSGPPVCMRSIDRFTTSDRVLRLANAFKTSSILFILPIKRHMDSSNFFLASENFLFMNHLTIDASSTL